MDELLALVAQIVPYHMTHNAEPEAVDLLLEVGDGAEGVQRGVGRERFNAPPLGDGGLQ